MQNGPRNNLKTVMAGLNNAPLMKAREFGETLGAFQKFLKVQQAFELEITEVAAKCGINKDELKSLVADFSNRHYCYGELIRLCERFNLNEIEVDTFAVTIAKSMKITRVRAWHEIEKMLEGIENEKEKI